MITIKRELKINKEIKQYLFSNMRYRNILYNKGVEYLRQLDEYNKTIIKDNEPYKKFNSYKFDTLLYNTFEKDSERYSQSIKGIRSEVCRDLDNTWNKVISVRTKHKSSSFNFKKFNPNNMSFRVFNKNISRIKIHNDTLISFKTNSKNKIFLKLKESIYSQYSFDPKDIKLISFIKRNNKYFICLVVDIDVTTKPKGRKKLAGIDLGQSNPIVIFDGCNNLVIKYPDNKLKRLECRLDKLHAVLSTKTYRSNNYFKVLNKLNKLYTKAFNISLDWRNKYSYYIVNEYKNIIVDEFSIEPFDYNKMNRRTLSRGMGYLQTTLKYMSNKYSCNYYKALPKTTCTCSNCGHENEPLPLDQRTFQCSKCNSSMDRDINASINCFNQYKELKELIRV